jgi:hypothetical protein
MLQRRSWKGEREGGRDKEKIRDRGGGKGRKRDREGGGERERLSAFNALQL